MPEGALKDLAIAVERTKAQIRSRVEHPFHIIKNLFHHRKTRYKGLAKNTAQLFSLFAGKFGDCTKSFAVGPWEQSVMCMKRIYGLRLQD